VQLLGYSNWPAR